MKNSYGLTEVLFIILTLFGLYLTAYILFPSELTYFYIIEIIIFGLLFGIYINYKIKNFFRINIKYYLAILCFPLYINLIRILFVYQNYIKEGFPYQEVVETTIRFNINFTIAFFVTLNYIIFFLYLGKIVLSKFIHSLIEYIFFGIIIFIFAFPYLLIIFGVKNILLVALAFNIFFIFGLYRKKSKTLFLNSLKTIKNGKFSENIWTFLAELIIFTGVTSILIEAPRFANFGTDAYRAYMLISKFIAEYNRFPQFNEINQLWPYPIEIIFSPIYASFNISITNGVYTFLLLILLSLVIKKIIESIGITNKKIVMIIILSLIFTTKISAFLIYQFKIDIFLLAFSLLGYFYLYEYLKSKKKDYVFLGSFILGFTGLIKATSFPLFLSILISSTLLEKTIKRKSIVILISVLIYISPFFLYRATISPFSFPLQDSWTKIQSILSQNKNHNVTIPSCTFSTEDEMIYEYGLPSDRFNPFSILIYTFSQKFTINASTYLSLVIPILLIFIGLKYLKSREEKSKNLLIFVGPLLQIVLIFFLTPIYTWYMIAGTSIIHIFIFGFILSEKETIIKREVIIFTLLAYVLFQSIFAIYLSNFSFLIEKDISKLSDNDKKSKAFLVFVIQQKEINEKIILKKDKSNYLITDSAPHLNSNFYNRYFPERHVFLPPRYLEDGNLQNLIKEKNIEMILFSKSSMYGNNECMSKTSLKLIKELSELEDAGKLKVIEITDSNILYEVIEP